MAAPHGAAAMTDWRRARTVLFDVEGTLVDAVPATLHCWQATLREEGFVADNARLHACSGMDGSAMLQEMFPTLSPERRKMLLEKQGRRYRRNFLKTVPAFEGVRGLFEKLKGSGRAIALATDCQPDELEHYLQVARVADLVDAVACGSDVAHGKPWPDLVQLALRRIGASSAIMVGDTPYDAEAAHAAGLTAIGVETGGFAAAELQRAGCVAVLPAIGDLDMD
jgi:HAD superfamily hydrolase (TIGR01549 family)